MGGGGRGGRWFWQDGQGDWPDDAHKCHQILDHHKFLSADLGSQSPPKTLSGFVMWRLGPLQLPLTFFATSDIVVHSGNCVASKNTSK